MLEQEKKISVIIPVYKVEEYLKRCLDSVCNQSYKNLEIILIDDGSTDNSGMICDEYARRDNRIKVLHKKNDGVSAARNTGLDLATGDYIAFADSDDFLDSDCLTILARQLELENADISICGMNIEDRDGFFRPYWEQKDYCILSKEEQLSNLITNRLYCCSVCDKLFKSEILSAVRFDREIAHNEDLLFVYEAMKHSEKAVFTSEPLYFYCMNEGSATTSKFNKTKLGVIDVSERIYTDISLNFPKLEPIEMREYMRNNISTAIQIVKSEYNDDKGIERIRHNVRWRLKRYLKSNAAKGYKLNAILLVINWNLFSFIVRHYE